MRSTRFLPGVVTGLVAIAVAGGSVGAQQKPVFRGGIAISRIEVTVLDSRTRTPVRGLSADDFIVKVGGKVQPVSTLVEHVRSTEPRANAVPAAFREAAADVTSNLVEPERLFVIVMNDAAGTNDPFERKTGIEIANGIIDSFDSGDMGAVVFTRDNRHAQDFTADRTLLRRAVERFRPVPAFNTRVLGRVREFLTRVPGPRKAVFFISADAPPGGSIGDERSFLSQSLERFSDAELSAVSGALGSATLTAAAHIPVYLFNTRGLVAPTADDIRSGRLQNLANQWSEKSFQDLARATGGRAVVANNRPAAEVPAIFNEMSSYYELAFEATYPLDGSLRWLQVSVRRPDVVVMPTDVPFATADTTTPVVPLRTDRDSGLMDMIGSPLPTGGLPLTLAVAPFAAPKGRRHLVALSLGVPSLSEPAEFDIDLRLFDGEGRRQLQLHQSRINVPAGRAEAEVIFPITVAPGRYNVRLSAARVGEVGETGPGMVAATVVVPDFERDTLSMSGIAIGRGGPQPGGRDALQEVLPFGPTSIRTFDATDQVGALWRVHQRQKSVRAVSLEIEIVDARGDIVVRQVREMDGAQFGSTAGVEQRLELPLEKLDPGMFLLRIVATADNDRVQRDVMFQRR
jgi:VWFA-related protein